MRTALIVGFICVLAIGILLASAQADVKGDSILLLLALFAPAAAGRGVRTLLTVGILLGGLALTMTVMDALRNGPEPWKIALFSIEAVAVVLFCRWLVLNQDQLA